jgi:dTDP-4-amino-4,6-dideoxygalactose transaminase
MKAGRKLGFRRGMFPETELLSRRILSLPIHQDLTEKEIRVVGKEILAYYKN